MIVTETVVGVVVILKISCYNRKACIPNNKGKMLIDILSPKTKLILVDITYKPPESNPILRTNG